MRIGVIGAGSWGTTWPSCWVKRTACQSLGQENQLVRENCRIPNKQRLPAGYFIPENIKLTNELEEAVRGKNLIVLSVPSHAMGTLVKKIKNFIGEQTIIVNTAKGLAEGSLRRLSQVIDAELAPCGKVAVLSGPNHAEEVSRLIPTASVVASTEQAVAEKVQDIFMTPYFRVYTNPDIIGVELGGALKNVIAIGAGICDGLNYGDNTKAALLTRGLVEITRLGIALGAEKGTFSGLTGLGDLFVTCNSPHSRNRYLGMMLGKNHPLER